MAGIKWLIAAGVLLSFFLSPAQAQVPLDIGVSLNVPFDNGNLALSGFASPNAFVTVRVDGGVAGTTTAAGNSAWAHTVTALTPLQHNIEIYQVDVSGRPSSSFTFSITIIAGSTISVGNIFLPTTIALETTSVPRPAAKLGMGTTEQGSNVTMFIFSHTPDVQAITSHGISGNWSGNVNRAILHLGNHTTYAIVQDSGGLIAPASEVKNFTVTLSADLNQDTKVELTDFSILMFSFERQPVPNLIADINDEGHADIVDFSIMLFYWTG